MIGQHVIAGLLPWLLAAAGIIAVTAWLRWAIYPMRVAFDAGRRAERIRRRMREERRRITYQSHGG